MPTVSSRASSSSKGIRTCRRWRRCRIGQNVKEVLESDLAGEYDARTSYRKSREICQKLGDYVTMQLFEDLLKDEEGHIDFLETQLDLLADIGDGKYGQLNANSADEAE